MGSSGNLFESFVNDIGGAIDPAGSALNKLTGWAGREFSGTFFGDFFRTLHDNDFQQITNRANSNVMNVIQGKEQFGSHKTWVDGFAGDIINPMMGGQTQAQKEQEAADKEIYDAWYARKYEKKKDKPTELESILSNGGEADKPILA